MKPGTKTVLRTAAWGTSGLLMLGAIAGTATAAGHKSDKSQDTATAPGQPNGPRPKLLHDLATVQTGAESFEEYASQFGEVSAISATSITVVSADDYSATYAIDEDTVVLKKGKRATTDDIAEGDKVFVRAEEDDGTFTADVIGAGKPPLRRHGGPGGHRPPGGPGFGGPGGPGFGGPGAPGGAGGEDPES